MDRTVTGQFVSQLRKLFIGPEILVLACTVALIEFAGPSSTSDIDDVPWVVLLPMLLILGVSVARVRPLVITCCLVNAASRILGELRDRLVISLGLDFHPERSPRLPPFVAIRKAVFVLALVAIVVFPAGGIGRELLVATRVRGLYTVHVIGSLLVWSVLLLGIVLAVPANLLVILEVFKRRVGLDGAWRIIAVTTAALGVTALLIQLQLVTGTQGCLAVLAFACLLPLVVQPVDPPQGPWLNLAMGRGGNPRTIRLGRLIGDAHRLLALQAFTLVALFAPGTTGDAPDVLPVTDGLLAAYGWVSAWLLTGGACLIIGEFNRRRRLYDPAYPRSRVLWASPGPEATALEDERAAVETAGWRLVVSEVMPGPEDADLLVGVPSGLVPPDRVPLSKVPPSIFLLADQAGALLAEAEERDKADRSTVAFSRLLTSTRPRLGDHGEGTFMVPQCWLVVGLTRDDERGTLERSPVLTFGQPFRIAFGTRLRRFLYEVMARADVDVFYVEDAVTPEQVSQVLDVLFDRHIARAQPAMVSEHDFVGITGVRVVLHDVDPEVDGIEGVDAHVARNAISRARIMIIGHDRRDDDDDDDPPIDSEANDSWLEKSLRGLFPSLQNS
jgi:hypothetical protein